MSGAEEGYNIINNYQLLIFAKKTKIHFILNHSVNKLIFHSVKMHHVL